MLQRKITSIEENAVCVRAFIMMIPLLLLCSCKSSESQNLANAPEVNVLIVEAQDEPVSFEYVAQTQSSHLVNIQARVNGFLDHQVYTEGDIVEAEQVLFIMDKRPFQAQVDAAKAAMAKQQAAHETAALNLKRVEPLTKLNALSQKDLDDAIGTYQSTAAAVDQAKANLETALLNLSYCTITSPIHGITSAALQQEGTYLNMADSQLTTVSALTPMWVNFSLSENQMQQFRDQIKRGALIPPKDEEYTVRIIQINGEYFPYVGTITFLAPYYNADTGTFLIRVTVDNPEGILRPNQYVRVQVEGAMRPNAILVPQRAVQQSAKGHFVWVLDKDNKTQMRPVAVGDWQNESWFITQGLNSGDQVITDGIVKLQPNMSVKIKSVTKGA